ncbi:sugar ABC transporter substrate-binding protein [Fictibacillus enclensis]|uniref:ABC transporter substrate-binding protein n=1 Tax=Fictibacillus enclensis TaxID=1017270 RepID=UPI0025A17BD3|nr:sugar ABC transporter substrate-binding protein [Fictibacillus enclensis]MDM5337283.1 sugar ABC transporter substrate-binding protein [Fictibacillus enclensis]
MKRFWIIILAFSILLLPACRSEGGSNKETTIKIATVNNPEMQAMQSLTPIFEKETGIHVEYIVLPENELRRKLTMDVAMEAGKFDIATISNYDAKIWAKNGWLQSMDPYFSNLSKKERDAYDLNDMFEPVRNGLSYQNELYALPFYAESTMIFYNKKLLEQAGAKIPLKPTWKEVQDAAVKVKQNTNQSGIVLRGLPGWGQIMAPLDTVINAYGGRWYDKDWNAQLTDPDTIKGVQFYVDLLKKAGQPGATSTGYTEALSLMASGKGGIWYDATVGAATLNDPQSSKIVGNVGYAYAPTAKKENTGGLYSWALGIEKGSKHKDAAFKFLKWATSKEYIKLVAKKNGWVSVPPGTRKSTYENPSYQKVAPFAGIVKDSIEKADFNSPSIDPVPYQGAQFVNIPEFQGLGTEVSQNIASSITGDITIKMAMKRSQKLAEKVALDGRYKK